MNTMRHIRLASTAIAASFAACALFAEEPAAAQASGTTASASAVKTAAEKNYKPLAEARAKIGEVIADPAKIIEVMRDLSPEDQKSFVADVNAAIAKLPGSVEDKTAKYLNVNRAALKGASAGNMANILAVTFATVAPESLVVLSERYAVDLFNRDADPSHKFTDAEFEKTATETVGKIEQATTGSDDAGVRNTLAILMFVRASNHSPSDLADKLVATMPDATTRELAKTEWIPAALAEGDNKSYEALLAYADAGKNPDLNIVLNLSGPQILDAMLIDITSGMENRSGVQTTPALDQAFGGFDENRVMTEEDTTSASMRLKGLGAVAREPQKKTKEPVTPPEPKPYPLCGL